VYIPRQLEECDENAMFDFMVFAAAPRPGGSGVGVPGRCAKSSTGEGAGIIGERRQGRRTSRHGDNYGAREPNVRQSDFGFGQRTCVLLGYRARI
jgi:hypothetical protein